MAAHPRRRPVHLDRTHRPTIRPRTRTDRHTPPTPARHTRTRRPTILRTRPERRLPGPIPTNAKLPSAHHRRSTRSLLPTYRTASQAGTTSRPAATGVTSPRTVVPVTCPLWTVTAPARVDGRLISAPCLIVYSVVPSGTRPAEAR